MKLGPITIGGRRDGSGYQHSTASIVITPEEGDAVEDCMAQATAVLVQAFEAAVAGVENRPVPGTVVTHQSSTMPAPARQAPNPKAPPLQSFPTTEVGQLAKDIVTKAAPAAGKATAPKTAPAPAPASPNSVPMTNEERLQHRIGIWRKNLAESEISESEFLRVCEVARPEDLKQLHQPLTKAQVKSFVDDVAKILANADDVKV